jgi:hypothetical protein
MSKPLTLPANASQEAEQGGAGQAMGVPPVSNAVRNGDQGDVESHRGRILLSNYERALDMATRVEGEGQVQCLLSIQPAGSFEPAFRADELATVPNLEIACPLPAPWLFQTGLATQRGPASLLGWGRLTENPERRRRPPNLVRGNPDQSPASRAARRCRARSSVLTDSPVPAPPPPRRS